MVDYGLNKSQREIIEKMALNENYNDAEIIETVEDLSGESMRHPTRDWDYRKNVQLVEKLTIFERPVIAKRLSDLIEGKNNE